jgi:predicted nucleic acid-binding Zn ribbon protein
VVASSQPCPVCGETMTERKTSACSDRCRARKSRLARLALPVSEAREIKALLMTILDSAW